MISLENLNISMEIKRCAFLKKGFDRTDRKAKSSEENKCSSRYRSLKNYLATSQSHNPFFNSPPRKWRYNLLTLLKGSDGVIPMPPPPRCTIPLESFSKNLFPLSPSGVRCLPLPPPPSSCALRLAPVEAVAVPAGHEQERRAASSMRGWRKKRIASGSMPSCSSSRTPEGMTGRAKGVGWQGGRGAKAAFAFLHRHKRVSFFPLFLSFPPEKEKK